MKNLKDKVSATRGALATTTVAFFFGIFGPSAAAAPAFVGDDGASAARALFAQGRAALAAGRFVESALHFEGAAARQPHAAAMLMAARAWEDADRPERAADAFARSLVVAGLTETGRAEATARLTELESALGTVVLVAPSAYIVQLDDRTQTTTPTRLHGSPGVHRLFARQGSGKPMSIELTLEAGQTLQLAIPWATEPAVTITSPPPDAATAVSVPEPSSPWLERRRVGIIAASTGMAAVGIAGLLWLEALQTKEGYNESPTRGEYNRTEALVRGSNIALLAGGVLVATGVSLWLWPEQSSEQGRRTTANALRLSPDPQGLILHGRF